MSNVDTFLDHHGVKGMRWGRRKSRDESGDSAKPGKPKKLTRQEVKAEKASFYEARAKKMLKTALEDSESLIAVRMPNDYATTITTGKEFVDYMTRGGIMDVRLSNVYATRDKKTKEYVVNKNFNETFVRSDKKKR